MPLLVAHYLTLSTQRRRPQCTQRARASPQQKRKACNSATQKSKHIPVYKSTGTAWSFEQHGPWLDARHHPTGCMQQASAPPAAATAHPHHAPAGTRTSRLRPRACEWTLHPALSPTKDPAGDGKIKGAMFANAASCMHVWHQVWAFPSPACPSAQQPYSAGWQAPLSRTAPPKDATFAEQPRETAPDLVAMTTRRLAW